MSARGKSATRGSSSRRSTDGRSRTDGSTTAAILSGGGYVEELHLEPPVAVEAGALEAEGGIEHLADPELGGQLAMIEKDGFYGHAVESTEAGSPMLALGTELAAFGEEQAFGREGGVLEASPKRSKTFQRPREVIADRLGFEIAVDPQNWLESLGRQPLADSKLKTLDQLVKGTRYEAAVRMRLDVNALPKPFQVSALASREWSMQSEWYRWSFTP